MSDFVRDLLVARRAIGNAGFVFPGPGETGHLMDALLPIVVRCRRLRHSGQYARSATHVHHGRGKLRHFPAGAEGAGQPLMGRDVTAGYVQISVERLREPTQRVANKLKELCGIAALAGENVAQLR